jgi:hypothetical protein
MHKYAGAVGVFVFNPKRTERAPWVKELAENYAFGDYFDRDYFSFFVREHAYSQPRYYYENSEEEIAKVKSQHCRADSYDT